MLIKLNEVALQTALTHMQSVNSGFKRSDLEALSRSTLRNRDQLYMANQPALVETLTHMCEVALLFQDKFTKEFLFELMNEAAVQVDDIPIGGDTSESDSLILEKEVSAAASTEIGAEEPLIRF